MRSSTGLAVPDACNAAATCAGSHGETRGSLRPVATSTAGYWVPFLTCRIVSISYRFLNPATVVTVPNSGMLHGPLGENSERRVLPAGTMSITPANRYGRSASERTIVMPPADPPLMNSLSLVETRGEITYSPHAMRSPQVLCLF